MLTLPFGTPYPSPCALVLGGFDGLHLGHRRLLSAAQRSGLPVVLTTVFGGKGKVLFTREERREIFSRAGVSVLSELDLAGELRKMPAETFARTLSSLFDVREAHCGEDFRFGKDALGTPELLKTYLHCPVTVHRTVKYLSGESGRARKFSASACKKYLAAGELSRLNACLCEGASGGYFVQGRVEHGRAVGRTYGFPTLNLSVAPEKLLPPDGVYGGLCETPKGTFPCIINIGARPTFRVEERKLEAYLDGFSGDLYGETVRVFPTAFFRGIEAFSSAEELKKQLEKDIETLRENER